MQCVIASVLYLSAECPVLQVSGQFVDNTAESHTGEHADADIRLLKVRKTLQKRIRIKVDPEKFPHVRNVGL